MARDPVITKAWSGADWFGPVMGLLDPVKEVNGAALRIKYGLSTGEREQRSLPALITITILTRLLLNTAPGKAKGLKYRGQIIPAATAGEVKRIMPSKFWQVKNEVNGNSEILLYGPIAGESSWWGDEVNAQVFCGRPGEPGR